MGPGTRCGARDQVWGQGPGAGLGTICVGLGPHVSLHEKVDVSPRLSEI